MFCTRSFFLTESFTYAPSNTAVSHVSSISHLWLILSPNRIPYTGALFRVFKIFCYYYNEVYAICIIKGSQRDVLYI